MEAIQVQLHKASDAEDSFAILVPSDSPHGWRAERGYGAAFQKVWTVEFQSQRLPDLAQVDWDAMLERVVEAWDLNDPVITDFIWPMRQKV